MSKSLSIISVIILCNAPSGYRRANLALVNGENEPKEVTQEQFDALKADPRISVQEVAQDDKKIDESPPKTAPKKNTAKKASGKKSGSKQAKKTSADKPPEGETEATKNDSSGE